MRILSVTELTQEIRKQLESQWSSLAVQGEILGLKVQASGHIYFTLKDKDSQLSAVLFQGNAKKLSRPPKEGDQVIAIGDITVYTPRGTYQLLVRELQYKGLGELLAQLHERKNRLQAEGLFAKERKKKLPIFPKAIGVITSPTGAVIQDIIQILQRRHRGFHLILLPVKVQGEGAKEEISKAIHFFNHHKLVDVLIVGRGGGSLEDLWAFNEEIVVRAIASSTIPVISAIGHETDISLSDFAADVRAPTPSAAAEIVLQEKDQHYKNLLHRQETIKNWIFSKFLHLQQSLASVKKNPYLSSPYLLLAKKLQRLDECKAQLILSQRAFLAKKRLQFFSLDKQIKIREPSQQIRLHKQQLSSLDKALLTSLTLSLERKKQSLALQDKQKKIFFLVTRLIHKKQEDLHKLSSHLRSIDPKNLLTKGYCILFAENRDCVILSTNQISPSQRIHVLMQDGELTATVETTTREHARQTYF
ncbi:MAG: exodeoxyribonuclease VII large subunit [Chlamydiae bacterium]|nr:exodeoxyribonuclease VII large subunit [Chlamydiota bacterium]